MQQQLRPIVISGPSGCGKSTLLKRLFKEYPDIFGFSISHTTRKPRSGEQDGREYHFVTRDSFQSLVKSNHFIEWAEFSGNLYGTSIQAVKNVTENGRLCILDIDRQGVVSVKKTALNARFLFIMPPDMNILEQRLRDRGTETEESLIKRLETARSGAKVAGFHDCIIVNDDLEVAFGKFLDFVFADPGSKFLEGEEFNKEFEFIDIDLIVVEH